MTGAFLPLIIASAAIVGAIIFGIARKGKRNNSSDGGNFKSDGQAPDSTNNRF